MDLHGRCEEMFRQHRDIVHWNRNGYALLNLRPPSGPVTFQLRRETKDARYSLYMLPGPGDTCIIRCDGEISAHGWITAEQAGIILDGSIPVSARPSWTTWEAAGSAGLAKLMAAAGYADGYAVASFTIHPGSGAAEPVPPVMQDRLRIVRDAIRHEALQARYPIARAPADCITVPLAAVPAETLEREPRLTCPAVTISGYGEDLYGMPCRAAVLPVLGAATAAVTTMVFEPPEDTSHDRDE